MSFSPRDAVKNLADKYAAGNKQTEGLGAELGARAEMTRIANSDKLPTTPVAPAAPEKHVTPKPAEMYGSRGAEKRIDISKMTPDLGSFEKGTKSVPKTGSYKLHEGEKVVPEKDNPDSKKGDKMATPYDMVTGGKKPKKEIKEMVHSKTHNGKHVVTHKHHSPMHHPDETHMFNNMDEVKDHMDAHDAGAEGAAPMTAAPSPMTAAPSPMPEPAAPGAGPAGM